MELSDHFLVTVTGPFWICKFCAKAHRKFWFRWKPWRGEQIPHFDSPPKVVSVRHATFVGYSPTASSSSSSSDRFFF
jgi:hypothetical protein